MGSNTHFIQYIPSLNLLKWATAPDRNTPAFMQEPTIINLEELFIHPLLVGSDVQRPEIFEIAVYPNPFNSTARIFYNLQKSGHIEISVLDITGRPVATLLRGIQASGNHTANWDSQFYPAGIYFVRLESSDQNATKQVTLLR
ncbi:MAG: T9SS type A sorting domain-containing protein [Candidatus Hatepunaea meridiana]|nr:T9SS type A sorting domain-containing protein [Candidatus Hatepunaea meridiana]